MLRTCRIPRIVVGIECVTQTLMQSEADQVIEQAAINLCEFIKRGQDHCRIDTPVIASEVDGG